MHPTQAPIPAARGAIEVARVERADADGLVVASPAFGRARARVATPGAYEPRVGDSVLVATDGSGGRHLIGVLRALRAVEPNRSLSAADGSEVAIEQDEDGAESLVVRDPRGRLLFEHRPAERRTVVHAPRGDLTFAVDGAIDLAAAGPVRIEGARVEVTGQRAVEVVAAPEAGGARSRLSLDGGSADLSAERLRARAEDAWVEVGRGRLVADALETTATRVRQTAQLVETQVGRLVERARESYREVEQLAQTRAGRVRMVADKTFHLLGGRTLIKAREDVKVRGEKIYLG